MFTATPPSVNRRRSGGGGRRSTGDRELPYVATKNNYSYGSQFSNMPKPPQLAETKVPLSVALKQQQDASNARMRAEQLERERVAREQGTVEPEDRRRSDPDKAAPGKKLQETPDLMEESLAQQETGSLRTCSVVSEEPAAGVPNSMLPPPLPRRKSPRLQSETSDHSYSIGFDTNLGVSRSYASEDDVGVVLGRKFTQNLADLPDDDDDTDDVSSTDEDETIEDIWFGTSLRGGANGDGDGVLPGAKGVKDAKAVEGAGDAKDLPEVGPEILDDIDIDEPPAAWGYDWAFWHWNNWLGSTVRKFIIIIMLLFFGTNLWIFSLNKYFGLDVRNLRSTPFTYIPPMEAPKDFDEIRNRMFSVEKEIGNWGIYYSQFENGYTDMIKSEVDTLERSIQDAKAQGRMSSAQLNAYNKELSRVKELQDSMRSNQASVSEELAALRRQLNDFTGNLPGKIVATQLDDGTYKFSDAFETILEEVVRKKASSMGVGGEPAPATTVIPGWDEFLEQNKQELENLIDQHTGVSLDKKGGVVLSHGTVKLLVEQKLKEFEAHQTKTLIPHVRAEATDTVKTYLKNNPPVTKEMPQSTDHEALDQYADWASQLVGGMVAPFITSPSYDYTTAADKWYYWLFGRGLGLYPQPAIAITPTKDPGQCWPFAGDSGTVGIRLARPIFPTHVSVEHIPPHLAIDISSAPRDVEFWAQFDDEDERNRVENAASTVSGEAMWGPGRLWDRESFESPLGPSGDVFDHFVKLAAFKYDIARGRPRTQIHQLNVDFMNMNITASTVIFRIRSNWGHPAFTCLYQVKVHGEPRYPPKVYEEPSRLAG